MNAPSPPNWSPNSCFQAFRTVSLLHDLRCKTDRTSAINAQVSATKPRRNFSQRTYPIHPIGPQTHILGRFRPFCYCTNSDAKWAELVPLMHKFVQRSRIGIFRNECTLSTPLDPKLMFWGLLDLFVTSRSSGLNRCHQCRSLCNKVASKFFATSAPDPPRWTPNSYFLAFRTVLLVHELWCQIG
jgi:hypothetical protein